jgi:hypothetical protein
MDCDRCGRYRPSREVVPVITEGTRVRMVCVRCRRGAAAIAARALVQRQRGRQAPEWTNQ